MAYVFYGVNDYHESRWIGTMLGIAIQDLMVFMFILIIFIVVFSFYIYQRFSGDFEMFAEFGTTVMTLMTLTFQTPLNLAKPHPDNQIQSSARLSRT